MNTIYKATNKINGKSYVGFDSDWPKRKKRHKINSNYASGKFYSAIRKYGWNNFVWEIIYQSDDKFHTLNMMEPYFIKEYNTYYEGYNMTKGGEGCFGATSNKIWINDGKTHKRIKKDDPIPKNWIKGRLNIKRSVGMSDESKNSISQKNKGKLLNGKNPAAKKILFKEQEYYSIKNASDLTGISRYHILKSCTFL